MVEEIKTQLEVVSVPETCSLTKGATVYLEDFMLQPVRKEVKRPSLLTSITGIEERQLTVLEGNLISI